MATQTQTMRRPVVQAGRVHDYLYGEYIYCCGNLGKVKSNLYVLLIKHGKHRNIQAIY